MLGLEAPTLESTVLACDLLGIPRAHVPLLAQLGASYVGGYRHAILDKHRRPRGPYRPEDLRPMGRNPMPPKPVEGGITAEWV